MIVRPNAVGAVVHKDLCSLWIYLVSFPPLTLTAWAAAAAQVHGVHGGLLRTWASTGLPLVVSLAMLGLIVAVVQLDPIGASRQDWLTRPLRGVEVLTAKAVFIVAFVFLPFAACQIVTDVIKGDPLGVSLLSALAEDWTAVFWLLPLLMFAGLTGTARAAFLVIGALVVQQLIVLNGVPGGPGVRWLTDVAGFAVITGLSLWTLWLAYERRAVAAARLTAILGVIVVLAAMSFIPGDAPARIQRALSRNAGAADTVKLALVAGCFPARSTLGPDGEAALTEAVHRGSDAQLAAQQNNYMLRPAEWSARERAGVGRDAIAFRTRLDVSGAPAGSRLVQDDARAVYVDGQGSPVAAPILSWDHARFYGPNIMRYGSDNAWLIARRDVERLGSARLRLDQGFTLLEPIASYSLPDDGRTHRLPGIGDCQVGPGEAPGGRVLDCLVSPGPAAMVWARVQGNSEESHTDADYAPNGFGRRVRLTLYLDKAFFADRDVRAFFAHATPLTATVTAYRAAAHFHRQLIEPPGALGGPTQTCPLPRIPPTAHSE
jgi:hypothetical protein